VLRTGRAIRYITRTAYGGRGWFRFYPSRYAPSVRAASRRFFLLITYYLCNWGKLVYVFVKRSFIFKIKRSVDFENKTSEK
jgi:hypothetical protein